MSRQDYPEINGIRTWVEVDRTAITHNYRLLRKLISPATKLMAVVKSNAYGHDIFQFSAELGKLGADWLGVDSVIEGTALRRAGIRIPILVLGYTLPEKFAEAAAQDITLTISTQESLRALALAQSETKFHLKIDTGMHRQGFSPEALPAALSFLKAKNSKLKANLTGLYTHFAAAKNPAFPAETARQTEQFRQAIKLVEQSFLSHTAKLIKHAAASAGTLLFPDTHFDLVRVGISLYGLWPAATVAAAFESKIELRPALAWKTIISEIKKLRRGDRIGYDLTETLQQNTVIGICPIGYWHGYPRALSSIGHVIVTAPDGQARRRRVLGRVSMDMIIIDLGANSRATVGDEVTLLGRRGDIAVTAEELALLTDTTNYEVITRLNPLMKRVYRWKGQGGPNKKEPVSKSGAPGGGGPGGREYLNAE